MIYNYTTVSLAQLQNHRQREKLEAAIHSKMDYPFDYFFEKTCGAPSEQESTEECVTGAGDSEEEESSSSDD